ncbi:MAG: hypothetical protein [Bacteriophage sp.]|nr:MAG: hypothetical protein [Bacteriophage sp.]
MKLLESVNICLHVLGEARVTSTDTRHPSVDLILSTIATKKKDLLERGWWFNTSVVRMFPDEAGRIDYPADSLRIESTDVRKIYTARNGYLYSVLENTSVFSGPVDLQVSTDIDFEDLPECVANVVTYRTARAVYVGDLGYDSAVSDIQQNEQLAWLQMETLHMRNMNYNTRNRRQFIRVIRALDG